MKLKICRSAIVCALIASTLGRLSAEDHTTENDDFARLADPELDARDQIAAYKRVRLLKPATGEARSLARISNSAKSNDLQRLLAANGLFDRHIQMGMTLSEVAAVLNNPPWLKRGNLFVIHNYIGPPPPIKISVDGETPFVLATARDPHPYFDVFFRVDGVNISADSAFDALQGKESSCGKCKITAIAIQPKDLVKSLELGHK